MKVSCICPTYNRIPEHQHLLEEAIESFIIQDYPDKELIILNDNSVQTIICDVPNIIVVNIPRRFSSLGEKYNAMVAIASGELLAPWEDDDISLPWRLSLSVRALAVTGAQYYNPRRYWFYSSGKYHHKHPQGVGHACSIYTRNAFNMVGGYPFISGAQDMGIDNRLTSNVKSCGSPQNGSPELHISKWYYIHRWDTGTTHLSGNGDHDHRYTSIAQARYTSGTYIIQPRWRTDYTEKVRERLCNLT